MNEAQVRLFREAVAQVEGSAGRSTLPDDSDDSDNGNGGDDKSNRRQDDLDDNLDAGASPSDYAEVDSLKARIAELESALSEKQDEIEGSLEERAELEEPCWRGMKQRRRVWCASPSSKVPWPRSLRQFRSPSLAWRQGG